MHNKLLTIHELRESLKIFNDDDLVVILTEEGTVPASLQPVYLEKEFADGHSTISVIEQTPRYTLLALCVYHQK